ncbi:MAG: hypothetical protein J0I09_00745 [Sphingobacteriia bacterium]|nr:hypothetical protein [Sphingobacteriia bacterium]
MYAGLLGLHSLLRWIILILLIVNIINSLVEANEPYTIKDKKWNLRLLIVMHINFLIGLYQYFFGPKGFIFFRDKVNFPDTATIMHTPYYRFWGVEHITGMLIAVVLITISRRVAKNDQLAAGVKNKKLAWLYILSLIIILASIPWPFRELGAPWFRSFLS